MFAFFRRPPTGLGVNPVAERLRRLRRRAAGVLLWEHIWRGLLPPLCVLGLFLVVSWTGLWLGLPHGARLAGVLLFALAFLAALWPLRRLRAPAPAETLARIDLVSGVPHRPAATLIDSLANGRDDPTTAALWALHRRRAEAEAQKLRAGFPAPRLQERDVYALRAGILVALVATAIVAGPQRYARVAAAFDWRGATEGPGVARLDAWLDPPAYTGRAPLLLNVAAGTDPQRVEAPVGSTLIVRASAGAITLDGGEGLKVPEPAAADGKAKPATPGGAEERRVLRADTRLTLRGAGGGGVFDLVAIPDRPPTIALTAAPKINLRGTFGLAYQVGDDYGVVGAEATFAAPVVDGRPRSPRSLVDPPRVQLALPGGAGNLGTAETVADLSDHPWAGARVTMTLVAHDEAGNEGRSDPVVIQLPQKNFTKPLARALAEQRRALALAPDDRGRVDKALEALSLAPEAFGTSVGVYLGLRVARQRLHAARTDPDLVEVADFLWQMALQIENGDLNETEKDLRAAEQQLQNALANGASDEEIAKLTENLRAAMDKFLKELTGRQPRDGSQDNAQAQRGRTVTPKDLQAMLDRLHEMSRAGNRADAQRTLDQLRNMLDNLQSAKRRSDPRAKDMAQALNDIDKLTREQQALRDETYQKGRKGAQNGQNGQNDMRGTPDDEDDEDADDGAGTGGSQMSDADRQGLQSRQKALRDKLSQLQKRLKGLGQDGNDLGEADGAMGDAGEALGQNGGNSGRAVDAQGRALQALRKGADQMAQQMGGGGQPGGEDEAGEGDGEAPSGQPRRADGEGDTDPLGRPTLGNPMFNPGSRYDPLGVPAAQRAQRVLEELRRRLSDPSRPRDETDYLERLLRRY